jgi:hypothetical protein
MARLKSKRERQLESIILDIYWMARRYADGRQSYAVGMYNDAIELAVKLGLPITCDPIAGSYFAQDGDPKFPKKELPYAETTDTETTGC